MKEIKVPEWWKEYKKDNPNEKDDYNPSKHCCPTYWKSYCECVQESLKKSKKKSRDRNVSGTLNFLKKNGIPYEETGTFNVVCLNNNGKKIYLSLKKDGGLFKCRFKGSSKWYSYSKERFINTFKS